MMHEIVYLDEGGVIPSNYNEKISGTAAKICETAKILIVGDIDRDHRIDSDNGKNVADIEAIEQDIWLQELH